MNPRLTPRVKQNDWSTLQPPEPGSWTPRLSVSIVIPAYDEQRTLPYTLAALKAQSYPSDLLEVVVVDDGSEPELELPELRPENTRLIRAKSSWGQANALAEGAEHAQGDVLHRLDADMVPRRDHVERQMRWHHLIDHAVVLGHKLFLDAEDLPPVADVLEAVEADTLEQLFAGRRTEEHDWVEKIWRNTSDLTTVGFRAFHVHVGATTSVSRALYRDAGGADPDLKLGEDVELGYRLAMKGAVFIPDRAATSWHLGPSQLMRRQEQVQRYNAPFIAERVPDFRKFRQDRGRTYRVPLIEVVLDVASQTFEQVKYTVDGVLQGVPGDVQCLLVGSWSELRDERRSPLDDPLLDLRLVHEEYAGEARITFVEDVAPTAFPAMYRMHMPAGWRPGETTMDELARDMQKRSLGLRSVVLADGGVVRLERTAAFERARRVVAAGEDIDDLVDQVAGTWWSDGVEDGFLHPEHAPSPTKRPRPNMPAKASGPVRTTAAVPIEPAGRSRMRSAARRMGLGRVRDALRPGSSR